MYYEKGYDLEYSINIATKILNKINMCYTIFEKNIDEDKSFSSIAVKDSNDEIISSGKGIGLQVLASGLFEALEHFYYDNCSIQKNVQKYKVKNIIEQFEKIKNITPIKLLDKEFNVLCTEIQSLDRKRKIWFPKFLLENPNKNVTDIPSFSLKYVTNNGMAIGLDREECLIHAINEVMERESLSKHIQDIFFDYNASEIRKISKNSIPHEIITNIDKLERILGATVNIFDITSYEGFYTIYVYAKVKSKPLPLKGSATSQIPFVALNRALSELYQAYAMYDSDDYRQDTACINNFKDYKNYFNAVSCDYSHCKIKEVDFYKDDVFICFNHQEQFNRICDFIEKNKLNVFEYQYDTDEDVYCSKVIILGTDNFQLINHGVRIIPMERS